MPKNKLTIFLGKNLGPEAYASVIVNPESASIIQYPEVEARFMPLRYYPLHPDSFVPQTVERIKGLLEAGRSVKLWTFSEYLVSWIAQAVGDNVIPYQQVEVRLYADDNKSYRDFVISRDGVLEGGWPIGWFMPSN